MNTYLIARHGQDEANAERTLNGHRDTNLTDLGRQQARVAGEKLKDDGITRIFSSPLMRAQQTAEIIAEAIGLAENVVVEDRLIERHFGVLTGKPLDAITDHATEILEHDGVQYFLNAKDAETFEDVLARANELLKELDETYDNETILLVTHGDTGKMLRAAFHAWSTKEGLQSPYIANSEVLHLAYEGDAVE